MKTNKYIILFSSIVAVASVAFFILSYNTFFLSDDFAMAYDYNGERIHSIRQILEAVPIFYMSWGGGVVCTALQFIFCGLLSNKVVFDIFNTLAFAALLLLGYKLIIQKQEHTTSKDSCLTILLFATIGWLLLPAPNETLFWIVGSTAYLWTTVEALLFLYLFYRYKDCNLSIPALIALGFSSFVLASSQILACASISGALIIYYLILHRNKLNKTIVILAIAYGIGTAIQFFAPGNFVRQAGLEAGGREAFNIYSFIRCFSKLKIFYLLLASIIIWFIKDRTKCIEFFSNQQFIIIAWILCVVAYGIVFRPSTRAAFMPEVFSLILLLQICNHIISEKWRMVISSVLLICCCIDYVYAYNDIVHQKQVNEHFLKQLVANGGEECFESVPNSHRMANPIRYEEWTYTPMMDMFDLDTVVLHPNVYGIIKDNPNACNESNRIGDGYIVDDAIVIRIPNDSIAPNYINVDVVYSMPRVWHRDLRNKIGVFKYERSKQFCIGPETGLDESYNYYLITFIEGKNEIINDVRIKK